MGVCYNAAMDSTPPDNDLPAALQWCAVWRWESPALGGLAGILVAGILAFTPFYLRFAEEWLYPPPPGVLFCGNGSSDDALSGAVCSFPPLGFLFGVLGNILGQILQGLQRRARSRQIAIDRVETLPNLQSPGDLRPPDIFC